MAELIAGEYLWFLDTLVCVRVSEKDGTDGLSVLEHRAPSGDSPPMHVHRTEDEIFHLLDGHIRLHLGGETHDVRAGESVVAPKGVPHTYRVESESPARWLTITSRGDFERFVRRMSRVAEHIDLPPRGGAPTPEAIQALTTTAAEFGIELVGPPLQ